MTWSVLISDKAQKQLQNIGPGHRRVILTWLAKNIDGCDNPRVFGKALTANRTGIWRYRIGDYRILVDIQDDELVVMALQIGHRKRSTDDD